MPPPPPPPDKPPGEAAGADAAGDAGNVGGVLPGLIGAVRGGTTGVGAPCSSELSKFAAAGSRGVGPSFGAGTDLGASCSSVLAKFAVAGSRGAGALVGAGADLGASCSSALLNDALLTANTGPSSTLVSSPDSVSRSSALSRAFSKSPFLGAGGSSDTPSFPLALSAPHWTVALLHSFAWSWIFPIALSEFFPLAASSVSSITSSAVLIVPRIVSLTWPISPAASSHQPAAVVSCCSCASIAFVCVSIFALAADAETPAQVCSLFRYDWSDCHPSLARVRFL